MVVLRKNQLLTRFFQIRIIVNGKQIYYLEKKKPVVIPIFKNGSELVASDGFHHSQPLQLHYQKRRTYYFKVSCIIEDDQLIAGIVLLSIIYAMGLTSDVLFIKVLSFVPVLYFLYLYYINRKKFLQFRIV